MHVLNIVFSFVFEQEEAYVEFLRLRRIPLEEKKCSDDAPDIIPQVK